MIRRILTALVGLVVACLALVGIRRRRPTIAQPGPAQEVLVKARPRIEAVRLEGKAKVAEADKGNHGTLAEESDRADKALERWK